MWRRQNGRRKRPPVAALGTHVDQVRHGSRRHAGRKEGDAVTLLSAIAWAVIGWCGTPWPRPWPWPPPPPPGPDPWLSKVIGVIGGVAGGWVFGTMFGVDLGSAAGLVVTFFGAGAGAVVLNDAYGLVARGMRSGG